MGNWWFGRSARAVDYAGEDEDLPCDKLLVCHRFAEPTGIPKSKKGIDGRAFVHDPEDFPRARVTGFKDFLRWRRTVAPTPTPSPDDLRALQPVTVSTTRDAVKNPPTGGLQFTWLGHSTVLLQLAGNTLVFDPIFSDRCSPVQWIGPKRLQSPPLQVRDLPVTVDYVVISHNHYDHLDSASVLDLARRFRSTFLVPLGLASWFRGAGVRNVIELDWTEQVELRSPSGGANLVFHCLPAQHFSSRGALDRNATLWASWLVESGGESENGRPPHKFYFGGDSGYCGEVFKRIGEEHGPISLSAIAIGAYGHPSERWFMEPVHISPEEAVRCHRDLRSERSVAIHWGTFQLTAEPILEPPKLLAEAAARQGLKEGEFSVLRHGETRAF